MTSSTALLTFASLAALLVGCDTPAQTQRDEHVEARENVVEAGKAAQAKTAAADEALAKAERKHESEVGAAQVEVAQAVVDAQKQVAKADATAAKANAMERYAEFDDLTSESESAFDGRAAAAVKELQVDLEAARKRVGASTDPTLSEFLRTATVLVATAQADLTALRSKTGKVLDDGEVGVKMAVQRIDVGMAINGARRATEAVYGQLAALQM